MAQHLEDLPKREHGKPPFVVGGRADCPSHYELCDGCLVCGVPTHWEALGGYMCRDCGMPLPEELSRLEELEDRGPCGRYSVEFDPERKHIRCVLRAGHEGPCSYHGAYAE